MRNRLSRLPIVLLIAAIFINLLIVAVYPVGERNERMWKAVARKVLGSVGLDIITKAQAPAPDRDRSGALSDRRQTSASIPSEMDSELSASISSDNDTKEAEPIQLVSDTGISTGGGALTGEASGSSSNTKATAEGNPPDIDAELQTPFADETLTPVDSQTTTPAETSAETPTEEMAPTPTLTPIPDARTLALGIISVKQGSSFTMSLTCDDLKTVAGFDVSIQYPAELMNIISVKKTSVTGSFMLLKQIRPGSLSLSVAGVEPIEQTRGDLVVFEGVISASAEQKLSIPLRFTKAKMYDIDSRALPLITQDGALYISGGDSVSLQTPFSSPTFGSAASPTPGSELIRETATRVQEQQPTFTPVDTFEDEASIEPVPKTEPTEPETILWPTSTPTAKNASSDSFSPTPTSNSEAVPSPTPMAGPLVSDTPLTDMNKDGRVDSKDLFLFVLQWEQASD